MRCLWEKLLSHRDILMQVIQQRHKQKKELWRQLEDNCLDRDKHSQKIEALLDRCNDWQCRQQVLQAEKYPHFAENYRQLTVLLPVLLNAFKQLVQAEQLELPVPQ